MSLNQKMSELPINDCRLPDDLLDRNPIGTKITLSMKEWTAIEQNKGHPLYVQANRWPNLSACGLMSCRRENEWNDEHTCSGDMTYIGVLPKSMGMCVEEFCKAAYTKCERHEDRAEAKKNCKDLRTRWKEIETVSRKKPEALQRAISAQFDQYRDRLKKKGKENELKRRKEEEDREEQITHDSLDAFLAGDGVATEETHIEMIPKSGQTHYEIA